MHSKAVNQADSSGNTTGPASSAVAAAVAALSDLLPVTAEVGQRVPADAVPASYVPDPDSAELAWWRDSMRAHDQRMAWWRGARFGLFIHWGIYSDLEGEWQGQPVVGYAEHVMRKSKIPIDVYKKQVAGRFNPTKFNADEWSKLAKDAGMGYIVITSKHHDGFAMYDSDVTPEYSVCGITPWNRDPMKELKAATERQGIRLGFYYSQAWDWGHPDGTGNDWDWDQPAGDKQLHGGKLWWEVSPHLVPVCARYVDNKVIPQVRELIAKYDPAVIWFDTPHKMPPGENYRVFRAAREAGPNVIINSRCAESLADYLSTADRPAELPPCDGDWEAIPTTNESYGYHKSDLSHKPVSHFIEIIAKTAARGGNLMLNVGPRGDGTFDERDVEILRGIGAWMAINGESIHGTTRSPLQVQAWGESTRKGSTLYLHVCHWPGDGRLVVGGLKTDIKRAYLLSDPGRSTLKVKRLSDLDVCITVPLDAPDEVDSVLVVHCDVADDGEIHTDRARLLSVVQPNKLRVFDGQMDGQTIRFGQGRRDNAYVEQWTEPNDSVAWTVRVNEPTTFRVGAIYDALEQSAGGRYAVTIGSHKLTGTVEPGTEHTQDIGDVRLEPGTHEIRVRPNHIAGEELMRLRTVTLNTIEAEGTVP